MYGGKPEAQPGDPRITVLIADDHEPTRREVIDLLTNDGRFRVLGQAAAAPAAVSLALRRRPRLCLLDIRMPGSGLSAAWEISARIPTTRIVMLTVSDQDGDLFSAFRAGAHGYLLKDTPPERILDKLERIANGEVALTRSLTTRLIEQFRDPAPRWRGLAAGTRDHQPHLTTREWQVLELLQRGLGTSEIARQLSVAPVTVRSHTASIIRKLRVTTREEALDLFPGIEKLPD